MNRTAVTPGVEQRLETTLHALPGVRFEPLPAALLKSPPGGARVRGVLRELLMEARAGLVVAALLALSASCSESKLRPGHCERDGDCPSGQRCVLEGAATFTCAAGDGGLDRSLTRPGAGLGT